MLAFPPCSLLQVCDSNGSMFEAFTFAAPLTAGIMYSGRGQAGQHFGNGRLKWGNFAVGVEVKSLGLLWTHFMTMQHSMRRSMTILLGMKMKLLNPPFQ